LETDMSNNNVVPFYPQETAAILERLLTQGDLARLGAHERTEYYLRVCQSLGLNPLTQPFAYLKLSGKTVLYALKGCTDQLRDLHKISVVETSGEEWRNTYIARVKVTTPGGMREFEIVKLITIHDEAAG